MLLVPGTRARLARGYVRPSAAALLLGAAAACESAAPEPQRDPAERVTTLTIEGDTLPVGVAGDTLVTPIMLRARDAGGRGVGGVPIRLTVREGRGAILAAPRTDAGGALPVRWVFDRVAGPHAADATILTASGSPATGAPTLELRAVAVAGPPARLVRISGDAQVVPPGRPLPRPLVVRAEDAAANATAGVLLRALVEGGGSVRRDTVRTDALGLGHFDWTVGTDSTLPQAVTVSVDAAAATSARFTARVTARPPASLAPIDIRTWGGSTVRSVDPGDFHILSTALRDPEGAPIVNAAVTLSFLEGPWPVRGLPPPRRESTLAPGGGVGIGPFVPVPDTGTTNLRYRIRLSADDYDAAPRETVVVINPPVMATLSPLRPGSLGGRVFDGVTGSWLAGAGIAIRAADGSAGPTTTTDATGRWYVTGLPAGSYTVTTSAAGYVTATTFGAAVDSVSFIEATPLAPASPGTGAVGGVVIARDLAGGGAGVTLELRSGQGDPTGAPVATTTAGSDGRYTFANVEPGTYTVRAAGAAVGGFRTVAVAAGRTDGSASLLALGPTSRPYAIRVVAVTADPVGTALFYRGSPATGDGAPLRYLATDLLAVDWPRYFEAKVWCGDGRPSGLPECDVTEMRLRVDVYIGNSRVAFRGVPNRSGPGDILIGSAYTVWRAVRLAGETIGFSSFLWGENCPYCR